MWQEFAFLWGEVMHVKRRSQFAREAKGFVTRSGSAMTFATEYLVSYCQMGCAACLSFVNGVGVWLRSRSLMPEWQTMQDCCVLFPS